MEGVVSDNRCHLCHRDLSGDSLVRCREIDCPTQATRRHASMVVLLVLAGLAIVIAALFGAVSWLTNGRVQSGATAAPAPDAAAPSAGAASDASQAPAAAGPWARAVPPGPTRGAAGASLPASRQPAEAAESQEPADPRAGALVQSFSCAERLSASRSWVCTHWSLATEDYNLSLQYRSTLAGTRNPEALRRARAAWLAKLDTLGANSAAISQSYRQWRAQLSAY